MELAEDVLDALRRDRTPRARPTTSQWDVDALKREVGDTFAIDASRARLQRPDVGRDSRRSSGSGALKSYEEKEAMVGREVLRRVERDIMLQIVDTQWKDHLYSLDHLKEGIGLRGYGQRDPLVEYKSESFELFQDMKDPRRRGDRSASCGGSVRCSATEARCRRAARASARPKSPLILSGPCDEPVPAFAGASAIDRGRAAPLRVRQPSAAARRRRRCGGQDRAARRAQGRPQRSVPVRQRQEIQEVSWTGDLSLWM